MLAFPMLTSQIAIEVELEEGEGGMAVETFTDYVSFILLL